MQYLKMATLAKMESVYNAFLSEANFKMTKNPIFANKLRFYYEKKSGNFLWILRTIFKSKYVYQFFTYLATIFPPFDFTKDWPEIKYTNDFLPTYLAEIFIL